MNLNALCRAVACAAASLFSATVMSADVIVGDGERTNVHVESDSVLQQNGAVWVQSGGVLDKTGKGDWTLPRGLIVTPSDTTINVRDGSVTIPADEGDTPTVETPTATLNKAALWIDPSVKCDLDTDGKSVLRLCDVRETATSVPYNYLRAVSMTNFVQSFPQIEGAGQGLKCVNFGALKSGKWMRLTRADSDDGSACATTLRGKIRHIFIVYQIVSSQGYVFSVEDSKYISFHPYYSSGDVSKPLVSGNLSTAPTLLSAKCYINGERCDPTVTIPPKGTFMVLEFQYCGKSGSMDGFFNDRNNTSSDSRQGGDYLAETLVFTNNLSEVERVQVGRYLSNRWRIPFASGEKKLKVAKGAKVNISAGGSRIPVTGEGVMSVAEADHPVIGWGDPSFHGEVEIPDGKQMLVRDDIYAYSLAGGDRLTVDTGLAKKCYSGDEVLRSNELPADSIVKDGNGAATIRSIPAGVKKLTVSGGTLSLSAPYRSVLASGSETEAEIPNSGFEDAASIASISYLYLNNLWNNGANIERSSVDWTGRLLKEADGTYADGWTAFFNAAHEKYADFNYRTYPLAPEGVWAFAFRGRCEIETQINVPVDGMYELSFSHVGYSPSQHGTHHVLEVFIGSDANSLVRHVRTIPFSDLGYVRHRVLVPDLAAGNKLLRIRSSTAPKAIPATAVDDIKLKLVSEKRPGFPVPNGDFESCTTSDISDLYPRFKSTKETPDGWTLTQVDWSGDATLPSVAPVRYGVEINGMYNGYAVTQPAANVADWKHGNVQLILASAKGAKAETSFNPPKSGLYFLKARVGQFNHPSLFESCPFSSVPAIEIAVKHGDGEFTSCGTVSPAGRMMNEVYWPRPVRITDRDAVITLAVSNTVAASAALFDDLEFVPCSEITCENLLSDGGFETNNDWELVSRDGKDDWNDKSNASYRGFTSQYYGYDKGEGLRAMSLIDFAGCYQQIRFPAPGRYRLRFIARARDDTRYVPSPYTVGAKMRAVLAQGGITNSIVSLETPTTNFVAHTVCFDVEDANLDYVFGFEADNDKRVTGYKDRMVFVDDASIVYCGDSFADGQREEFTIPEDMAISVASGAKLDADFAGTRTLAEMRLGGRRVSGVISKDTHPEYISGLGMFYVQPKGTCIHFR